MNLTGKLWTTAVLLGLASSGCGAAAQLTASPEDHADYRRARSAEKREEQLSLAWQYLETHPKGRYRDEVRAWFGPAEAEYYLASEQSVAGLRAYLQLLPEGPHAENAQERLDYLRGKRRRLQGEEAALAARGLRLNQKLDRADERRKALLKELRRWVILLSSIRSFGQPTTNLSEGLLLAFRWQEPVGKCRGRRCTKVLTLDYLIPDAGRLQERAAIVEILIELDADGKVARAVLAGPDLFSRVGEALALEPVGPGDGQGRAESIGRALEQVEYALESTLPVERCGREAVAPVVLERVCDTVRVRLIAALEPGQDDQLVVEAGVPR